MAHAKLESKWGYVSPGGILRYPEEPPFPVKEYDAHYDHIFEMMEELEAKGEILIHRITEEHKPIAVYTRTGRIKLIPTNKLWHHKSCGQCGNIPGYPASVFWFMNKFGLDYLNEPHQTSCTAWNYHGSGTSNPVALAAVWLRNMHQAWKTGYYPLIHCGTSFGSYKETREQLIMNKELRDAVKPILKKLGRLTEDGRIVIPQEIVHYSEWVHAMRYHIKELYEKEGKAKGIDVSNVRVAIHNACHTYKMIADDYPYDPEVYNGQRPAASTAVVKALGAQVVDYSTWYDCCGFGFRHILTEREFTRSMAIQRKLKVIAEEVKADLIVTHDTGCTTTFEKNQWIGKAHGMYHPVAVMSDVMFAALACGAHPFKVVQLYWNCSHYEPLLEKMGITNWRELKKEWEDTVKYISELEKAGKYDELMEFFKEYDLYEPYSRTSTGKLKASATANMPLFKS
ncbi:heterodisulfide reductase-related iron-sulfur binding cluster [Thermocrinis sp.]